MILQHRDIWLEHYQRFGNLNEEIARCCVMALYAKCETFFHTMQSQWLKKRDVYSGMAPIGRTQVSSNTVSSHDLDLSPVKDW